MRKPTAEAVPSAYTLYCPGCDEPLQNPADDSFTWEPGDSTLTEVTCSVCGVVSKIPKAVRKVEATTNPR